MIELHGVSKSVPSGSGTLTILHPIDLVVPAKEVVALTGASGRGKSTLLGLIAGRADHRPYRHRRRRHYGA